MFNQILRPVARNVVRGSRAYHPPAHFKQATMNEVPVPQGSWKARYETKQKKYNMYLVLGVGVFVSTIAFARGTGAIYMNYYPPTPKDE